MSFDFQDSDKRTDGRLRIHHETGISNYYYIIVDYLVYTYMLLATITLEYNGLVVSHFMYIYCKSSTFNFTFLQIIINMINVYAKHKT